MTAPQSPAVADASLPEGVNAALLGRQDAAGDVQPCGSAEPVTGAAEPTPSGFGASPAASIYKLGATLTVSQELIDMNRGDVFELVRRLQREAEAMTPAQREQYEARRRNAVREARKPIKAAHTELLASLTDPTLRALAELHAPTFSGEYDEYGHCDGCEAEGYESEAPGFPCRTYELIATSAT